MNPELQQFLDFTLDTAKKAGDLVLSYYNQNVSVDVKNDTHNNLVTEADLASEKLITEAVMNKYSDHQVLGEESGKTGSNSEYTWIIDPIDGTNNFFHGVPFFAINIALLHNNEVIVAVTHAPKLNETFWATKNGGAFLNGEKIQVSKTNSVQTSMLSTGFPPERTSEEYKKTMQMYAACMQVSHGVRRMGAAAIDLGYVACGRFEGFFELGLQPWDVAPGLLIVKEAGGTVTNFDGTDLDINGRTIIATNGVIHQELLKIINPLI